MGAYITPSPIYYTISVRSTAEREQESGQQLNRMTSSPASQTQDEQGSIAPQFLPSPLLQPRRSRSPHQIPLAQPRDPTPRGSSRTSASSSHTHRRNNRSVSTSHRKSPIIFPHARSSCHSSPRGNNSSLSRTSSLHSNFSEAAYRSSNCNSPITSPQPFPNLPNNSAAVNAAAATTPTTATSFQFSHQRSGQTKSRHPSFSFHGLEGKGSTGTHVQKPDYSEAKIVVAMVIIFTCSFFF